MAKSGNKKTGKENKNSKNGFRIVKDSPAATKISETDITKAVEKAIAFTAR